MSRDPYIEQIEAKVDDENERRADEYWEAEAKIGEDEDPEPYDEMTGPCPVG